MGIGKYGKVEVSSDAVTLLCIRSQCRSYAKWPALGRTRSWTTSVNELLVDCTR